MSNVLKKYTNCVDFVKYFWKFQIFFVTLHRFSEKYKLGNIIF